MASIQRPIKTYGTRNYVAEVAAAPSNYDPVLANELDADLDTMYAAWNTGADTVNIADLAVNTAKLADGSVTTAKLATAPNGVGTTNLNDASVTEAKLAASAHLWTIAGATMVPVDASKTLALGGIPGAGTAVPIRFGEQTVKSRFVDSFSGVFRWTVNADDNFKQDDNTKVAWMITLDSGVDKYRLYRAPTGGSTAFFVEVLTVDNAGNLTIAGGTAIKASGTAWANPSDRRLKDDIADYPTGLAAILQLQPRTFRYNGKGGSTAGMRGYGFIADEIAPVMPETVGTRAGKLDPADEDETDIQTLDQSNLLLALVNAVKELAARVDALEHTTG